MSAQSARACPCFPFQTFVMGDTYVYFIKSVAPIPRSEPNELQICTIFFAAGLPQKKFTT